MREAAQAANDAAIASTQQEPTHDDDEDDQEEEDDLLELLLAMRSHNTKNKRKSVMRKLINQRTPVVAVQITDDFVAKTKQAEKEFIDDRLQLIREILQSNNVATAIVPDIEILLSQ